MKKENFNIQKHSLLSRFPEEAEEYYKKTKKRSMNK